MSRHYLQTVVLLAVVSVAVCGDIFDQMDEFWHTMDEQFDRINEKLDSAFDSPIWEKPLNCHSTTRPNFFQIIMRMEGITERDIIVTTYQNVVVVSAVHEEPDLRKQYQHTQVIPPGYSNKGKWRFQENTLTLVFDKINSNTAPAPTPLSTVGSSEHNTHNTRSHGNEQNQNRYGSVPIRPQTGPSRTEGVNQQTGREQSNYGTVLPASSTIPYGRVPLTRTGVPQSTRPSSQDTVQGNSGVDQPPSHTNVPSHQTQGLNPGGNRAIPPYTGSFSQQAPGNVHGNSQHGVQGASSSSYGQSDRQNNNIGQTQQPTVSGQSGPHAEESPDTYRTSSHQHRSGGGSVQGDPNTYRQWESAQSNSQAKYHLDDKGRVVPEAGREGPLPNGITVHETRKHFRTVSDTHTVHEPNDSAGTAAGVGADRVSPGGVNTDRVSTAGVGTDGVSTGGGGVDRAVTAAQGRYNLRKA